MSDDIHGVVIDAVLAIHDDDEQRAVETLNALVAEDQHAVVSDLLRTIYQAAGGDPDVSIPATKFLPDPTRSRALLRAVVAQDSEAIAACAPEGYGDLMASLLSLASALMPPEE